MSEKWTEGPLQAKPYHGMSWGANAWGIYAPAGDEYAEPGELVCIASDINEADAKLWAAAPEMAEALSSLILYVDGHESRHCGSEECRCGYRAAIGKARAALSKARGEKEGEEGEWTSS